MVELTAIESVIWRDLNKLTTTELEDLVGIHFSFNENASEDFVEDFHLRQHVAQSIIDKRLGRSMNRDASYVWRDKSKDKSIWSTPSSGPKNSQ
jgi:hypothetical protein